MSAGTTVCPVCGGGTTALGATHQCPGPPGSKSLSRRPPVIDGAVARCRDCRYWWWYESASPSHGPGDTPSDIGECRRFPPAQEPTVRQDGEAFGQWIDTEAGQWCGEFRPAGPGGECPTCGGDEYVQPCRTCGAGTEEAVHVGSVVVERHEEGVEHGNA